MHSQLFELRADNPLVFAIGVTTLLGAAVIATLRHEQADGIRA